MKRFWLKRTWQWGGSLCLVTILFAICFYGVVVLPLRQKLVEDRLELAKELTQLSVSILHDYHQKETTGELSQEEAQAGAKDQIRNLRYGENNTGYFFCVDDNMLSLVHPFRRNLEGEDMSGIVDPTGKAFVKELVVAAKEKGEAHVQYVWYRDPEKQIRAPKLSYVFHFRPWKWTIGTGLLIHDIEDNITGIINNMIVYCTVILVIIFIFSSIMIWQESKAEFLRQQAEETLRKSEENLRITLKSIGDAVITTDVHCNVMRMNPAAEQLTGWNITDAKGKPLHTVFQITNATTQDPCINPAQRVLATGKVVSLNNDTILTSRNGTTYYIADSGAPITSKTGEIVGTVLVFRNVTEDYKHLSERSRLSKILESTSDIVSTAQPDMTITFMNKAGREILGWQEAEEYGTKLICNAHPRWAFDKIRTVGIPIALKTGIWSGESALLAANGTEIPVSQVIMAHYSNSGEVEYFSTIMRDLRDRINAEKAQHQLEEQLLQSKKMDSLGQLAGGIAHDFNNMLGGIIGATDILINQHLDNPKAEKCINLIVNTVERASDLTQKLLTFSRKGKHTSTTFSLHDVVQDTITILERSIDKRITLKPELNADSPIMSGDPSQIQNALLNLGLNARDAMPEGGTLCLSTHDCTLDQETCNALPFTVTPGSYVKISIKDTGSGIPESILNRIFEPFFTTKEVGKGTGLGLAAVYGTITEHHGAIIVESQPHIGTTFTLYLPSIGNGAQDSGSMQQMLHHGSGCILIADDEDIIRLTLQQQLEDLGYKVLVAENGDEAVKVFTHYKDNIDAVILDMVMPSKNGQEAFEEIIAQAPDAKILIASGFASEAVIAELTEKGLLGFVKKPFRYAEISKKLAEILHT